MAKDYYEILGISKDATKEEIKKAYKRKAKKYHPDINKEADASEKFKEINEAASVLGDDQKRQHYDQFGKADGSFDYSQYGGFRDFGADFDFGDIFDAFFGGGFGGFSRQGGRRNYRGADLRFDLNVSLEDVNSDIEKTIIIPRMELCEKCNGSGANSQSDIETCGACHGSGRTTRTQRTPFGLFQTTGTCSACKGEGKIIKNPCKSCEGEGRVRKNVKLKINIPAGVENGMRLRIDGEGEAGPKGGRRGDLYVVIHVKEHEIFKRQGPDLYLEVPISFVQAALGDTIEIPTIDGKTKLKIPSGTQTHTIFQMRGKGLPKVNGFGRGSQKNRVIIETPEKLTRSQKKLLKEYDESFGDSPAKKLFSKIFK